MANLWRTTEDITSAWDTGQTNGYPMGIQNIVNVTVPLAGYAGPGGFNDPDMLEVGNGGMTDTEMRSHFALWAMHGLAADHGQRPALGERGDADDPARTPT